MAKQFTLGKKERLKSLKQIEELFEKGEKFHSGFYRAHYVVREQSEEVLQFGVGASSRQFKKAVDRNRIKRLTREAWRLQKNALKDHLDSNKRSMNLFIIYTGKSIPVFAETKEGIQKLINKLISKIVTTG